MEKERLNTECIKCLVNKYVSELPGSMENATKVAFIQGVLKIIENAKITESAPELVAKIDVLTEEMFGAVRDYGDIKSHFNRLVMSIENDIEKKIESSDCPVETALKYAMIGNYIDFGAVENVNDKTLFEFIDKADEITIPKAEFDTFLKELERAKKLVYLTDNCGEIVFDKIFINELLKRYCNLDITVIVRGYPVLNDGTMNDAREIGLDKIVRVISNGTRIAGTCLHEISKEAGNEIDSCDLVIAKGQGNFETLRYCEKNVYYAFMCKCKMFAERFNVPLYSGMFVNDLRMGDI